MTEEETWREHVYAVRHYLATQIRPLDERQLLRFLGPLRGHNQACFCSLVMPCHGDVLVELLNGRDPEMLPYLKEA
jgi:Domain of unknown function (DUF4326)